MISYVYFTLRGLNPITRCMDYYIIIELIIDGESFYYVDILSKFNNEKYIYTKTNAPFIDINKRVLAYYLPMTLNFEWDKNQYPQLEFYCFKCVLSYAKKML
jgi:hypothetical protein